MSLLSESIYFLKKKSFIIPLILVLVLSFGFSVTHIAQGIDDLCRTRYVENGSYIAGGRIFGWLVMLLLGSSGHETWLQALLGDLFLGIGSVLACVLFRRACKDRLPFLCYTIFVCLLVSCPLNMAQWVYADTAFMVKLSFALVPLSLLSLDQYFSSKKLGYLLLALLFILLPVGMFESAAAIYVFYTAAYLTLREFFQPKVKNTGTGFRFPDLLLRGVICACILAVGILLKSILASEIISRFSITGFLQDTQTVNWFSGRFTIFEQLVYVLKKILVHHVIAGFFYLPLGLVLLGWLMSLSLIVLAFRKGRPLAALSTIVMCLAPILITFIHGDDLPYRTNQAAAPFVAFMLTIPAYAVLSKNRNRILRAGIVTLSLLLALVQSIAMDRLFRSDYDRWQGEISVLTDLYDQLSDTAAHTGKPVCFVAHYDTFCYDYSYAPPAFLGLPVVDTSNQLYDKFHGRLLFMPRQLYLQELPSTSLNWACNAFFERDTELHRILNHLGLTGLMQAPAATYDAAVPIAQTLPAYPNPGCIQELENCIIVNLG